jgi:hypothetical protein
MNIFSVWINLSSEPLLREKLEKVDSISLDPHGTRRTGAMHSTDPLCGARRGRCEQCSSRRKSAAAAVIHSMPLR